jgi:hypothetical protein
MQTNVGRQCLHQQHFSPNRPSGAAHVATGKDSCTEDRCNRPEPPPSQRHRAKRITDDGYSEYESVSDADAYNDEGVEAYDKEQHTARLAAGNGPADQH